MKRTRKAWPESGKPLEAFGAEIRHDGRLVGGCMQTVEIVRRANAHDDLVATLKKVQAFLSDLERAPDAKLADIVEDGLDVTSMAVEAALAKATK